MVHKKVEQALQRLRVDGLELEAAVMTASGMDRSTLFQPIR
jgi:hypothetical protein